MSALAKHIIGEATPPPIEELLPEMVKIAEEGDVIERLVRFLITKGYTDQDLWREIKKLSFVSEVHTMALRNTFQDIQRGGQAASFSNPLGGLKNQLRYAKRRPR